MGIIDKDLKEYIVALNRIEDLEIFYDDMESPGGSLYIPNRTVDLAVRRPISPNTHYYLTDQEAEQLRLDPRVRAVNRPIDQQTLVRRRSYAGWEQYSDSWYKGPSSFSRRFNTNDKNWALLRCVEGVNRSNWGSDGILRVEGKAYTDASGKNVDVIILDGLFRQTHAEFAKNIDGTGGTRVIPLNWYALSASVGASTATNYNYTLRDNHGAHVAGIACGTTQGWARDANIYNLGAFGENNLSPDLVWDYILAFHQQKSINPVTGRKNPTVVNYSVGLEMVIPTVWILWVRYRGNLIGGTRNWGSNGFLKGTISGFKTETYYWEVGMPLGSSPNKQGINELIIPIPDTNGMADVDNCINQGIHIVMAAGNQGIAIDLPNGQDYNNYVEWQNLSGKDIETFSGKIPDGAREKTYYCRRSTVQTEKAIVVGALDSRVTTTISVITCRGPGVDIFAPGTGIVSAISDQASNSNTGSQNSQPDPRARNQDRIDALEGSSMAAPQVTGMIACFLEKDASITPAVMKNYIINNAKTAQITNKTGQTENDALFNMQNAANRYLFYPQGPYSGGGGGTVSPPPTLPLPTYAITPSSDAVNEGGTVVWTVTTTNFGSGTLYYVIRGTTTGQDFTDGQISGSFEITNNFGAITKTLREDLTTEGSETIIMDIFTGSTSGPVVATSRPVTVNDTSKTQLSYFNLTVTPGTSILEGDTVEICLNVNPNLVSNGTKIPFTYTIEPIQ